MLVTVFCVSFTTFYVIWNNVLDAFFFVPEAAKKMTDILIRTTEMLVIPVGLLAIVFSIAGILLSHKVAGPIFRVERVAEELSRGNLDIKVKFRKGDELHDLANSLNTMIDGIKSIVREDKVITNRLVELADKLKADMGREKSLKKDVKDAIDELSDIVGKLKKTTDKFII